MNIVQTYLAWHAQGPKFTILKRYCELDQTNDPILCSVSLIKTMTETKIGEERVYLPYTSRSQAITKGSQGRAEIGAQTEPQEESYLLSCLVLFAFSYNRELIAHG